MNVPVSRWVRSWAVRVLNATVTACFRVGAAILALGFAVSDWRDRLDPPPPVPADMVARNVARIVARIEADVQIYQPTHIDREVANVTNSVNCAVFLLPAGPRQPRPCYVVDGEQPYGRLPPS